MHTALATFWATYAPIKGTREATITLACGRTGEWRGAQRVTMPRAATSLYEACYRAAEQAAAVKGGRLDRFSLHTG